MTPLHTRVEEILNLCDPPGHHDEYDAFDRAKKALNLLLEHPNKRCLNCGSRSSLRNLKDSPLSVCGNCLGILRIDTL